MIKIKSSNIFNVGMQIIYMDWAILQKLRENNFEWIENTPQFNEDFMKRL